jgi:hypothetical protein
VVVFLYLGSVELDRDRDSFGWRKIVVREAQRSKRK